MFGDSTTYATNITPGAPPLLWSNINDAFRQINANFQILEVALGAAGITPIDFNTLESSVSPAVTNYFRLGEVGREWKGVHAAEWSPIAGSELNGLWAGSAQIKGVGLTIDLPAGSTVDGNLIIDPDKTFFKSVEVDDANRIEANEFSDTLKLVSGTAMQMVVSSGAESITINNTGVTALTAGTAISVSSTTGNITVTNTGVVALSNSTALPAGATGRAAGTGITVSASSGTVSLTNTGVIDIAAGTAALTVSKDAATGIVTITNAAPAQNSFAQIEVDNDVSNRLTADTIQDVLSIISGQGISVTKNVSTDTLTFSVNPVFDLKGSIFGDDSTKLVDAVSNYIYGNIEATTLRTSEFEIALGAGAGGDGLQGSESIAIGMSAGAFTQGDYAVAIGSGAGNIGQGDRAIAIGATAGVDQGDYAISIGNGAGYPSAVTGSIAINASGFTLDAPAAGLYINPIRASTTSARPIVYDTTTKELKYTSTLEFVNSTISTSDSSGITVDVITTFNSDIVVENDLTVAQRITLQGSRVLNLADIKSIVAASTDFADFKTKIAALA